MYLFRHHEKSTKINKVAHCCNFSRISVSRLCVKEAVVAAAFMFELNIFQIFAQRNDILFCRISNAICIKISSRQYEAITVFTVVEVHSSTLRSTRSQFIFLKCDGFVWPRGGSLKQKHMHLLWAICNLVFKALLSGDRLRRASIVKMCLYKSIIEQCSRRIIQIVSLSQ